ncbi:Dabb family protein [Paenibacillus algorifonticola]|uniref:Dabb family protein n=1 Tax=Paenibacillus algorifonticola TaxID=684063 RepID=UPI003D2654DC
MPGIAYLTAGRNITNETERQQGYTLALRITFKDQAALETYGSHPVHQEFVSLLDGVIDNIIVADYPIHG